MLSLITVLSPDSRGSWLGKGVPSSDVEVLVATTRVDFVKEEVLMVVLVNA